jgi:hypothetical protein
MILGRFDEAKKMLDEWRGIVGQGCGRSRFGLLMMTASTFGARRRREVKEG